MNHEQKLDDILAHMRTLSSDITEIKVVQAEQKTVLVDHTRRSAANEESLLELRDLVLTVREGFANQLRPIQKHVDRVQFLFAIVVGAGAIVGAVVTIVEAITGAMK